MFEVAKQLHSTVPDYSYVSFDELLKESDFLVICLKTSAETVGLIDASALGKMKNDAIIVNVAR